MRSIRINTVHAEFGMPDAIMWTVHLIHNNETDEKTEMINNNDYVHLRDSLYVLYHNWGEPERAPHKR